MGGGGGGGTTDELLFGDLGVIPPLKRPVGLNGVVAIFPMKDGEVGDGLSLKTNKNKPSFSRRSCYISEK